MEMSLVLLVIVEIGAVKYMMSRQVCKRIYTLIREEYSNSGAVRHAMRAKSRIDSRGSCGKHSAENHILRQYIDTVYHPFLPFDCFAI